MYRKAQTLSYDFFIATAIFIAVLTMLLYYWTYSSKQIDDTVAANDVANKLFLASQVWFTEGYPQYWDASNVTEIGLASNDVINSTKMNILNNTIGYQKVLDMVGVRGYNVYYRVFNGTNATMFEFGAYPSNAVSISRFDRLSVLNGTLVTIQTLVWR